MKALPICERKANLGNKSNMRGLLVLGFNPTLNLRAQPLNQFVTYNRKSLTCQITIDLTTGY